MKRMTEITLVNIIIKTLNVTNEGIEKLTFEECEEWDSVSHMTLIAQLEEAFGNKIEGDKVLELLSYRQIKEWVEAATES